MRMNAKKTYLHHTSLMHLLLLLGFLTMAENHPTRSTSTYLLLPQRTGHSKGKSFGMNLISMVIIVGNIL